MIGRPGGGSCFSPRISRRSSESLGCFARSIAGSGDGTNAGIGSYEGVGRFSSTLVVVIINTTTAPFLFFFCKGVEKEIIRKSTLTLEDSGVDKNAASEEYCMFLHR